MTKDQFVFVWLLLGIIGGTTLMLFEVTTIIAVTGIGIYSAIFIIYLSWNTIVMGVVVVAGFVLLQLFGN